jgi:hypothetical protein
MLEKPQMTRIRVVCGSIVAYYLTHWLLNALARTHDFRENVVRHVCSD